MSTPPNQFRRGHPWTRFVLLDSSPGTVPSQAKVTHSLTLSLKTSNAHVEVLRLQPTTYCVAQQGRLTNWLVLAVYSLGDQFTH